MNRNKKRISAAVAAVAVVFIIGGGYAIVRNDKKVITVKETASESMDDAQSNLNKAQKAFDTARKGYDGLSDSAGKEDRQKAYDALKSAYDNLTAAQETIKRRTANSADVEKINKEKEENEKVVLAAEKKLTDAQKSSDQQEVAAKPTEKVKQTAKATAKTDNQKQTVKQNPAPAQPKKQTAVDNKSAPAAPKATTKQKSCHVVNHPAVTHQEPVYQTVHHDEVSHMESYVVKPAWDEQVNAGDVFVCNDCGQKFNTVGELEDHADIVHDNAANYHIDTVYKTVHHDAVMGQRKVVDHAAYDERVATGTYTVTDKAAWSENVCS